MAEVLTCMGRGGQASLLLSSPPHPLAPWGKPRLHTPGLLQGLASLPPLP